MDRLGLWQHGALVSLMGRFCLRTVLGQAGDMIDELEPLHQIPVPVPAIAASYALALTAAGRVPEARAIAAQMPPVHRDLLWLVVTAICALLAIAVDDTERARSCYRELLPYAARPAGTDTGTMALCPPPRYSATSPPTSALTTHGSLPPCTRHSGVLGHRGMARGSPEPPA